MTTTSLLSMEDVGHMFLTEFYIFRQQVPSWIFFENSYMNRLPTFQIDIEHPVCLIRNVYRMCCAAMYIRGAHFSKQFDRLFCIVFLKNFKWGYQDRGLPNKK